MPTLDDVNTDLQTFKLTTTKSVSELYACVGELKKDVDVLKVDDAKYKGFIEWFDEKVKNNPKVTVIFTAVTSILFFWATTYVPTLLSQWNASPPNQPTQNKKVEDVKGLPKPPQ